MNLTSGSDPAHFFPDKPSGMRDQITPQSNKEPQVEMHITFSLCTFALQIELGYNRCLKCFITVHFQVALSSNGPGTGICITLVFCQEKEETILSPLLT